MKTFFQIREGFKYAGGDSTNLERLAVKFKLGLKGVKTEIRKSPKYGEILVVDGKVFVRNEPKTGNYLVYRSNGKDETKISSMTSDVFGQVVRTAAKML